MAVSEAHRRANRKYDEKAYKRVNLVIRNEDLARLKEHAARAGESLNQYIINAIKARIEKGR